MTAIVSDGGAVDQDRAAIAGVLETYLDAFHQCDSARLREVLHASALYATVADGRLLTLDMPTYFAIVDRRISPARQGHDRIDRVVSVDLLGDTAAMARVDCAAPPRHYHDVLSLLKIDGRWWILSKVFHCDIREGLAACN